MKKDKAKILSITFYYLLFPLLAGAQCSEDKLNSHRIKCILTNENFQEETENYKYLEPFQWEIAKKEILKSFSHFNSAHFNSIEASVDVDKLINNKKDGYMIIKTSQGCIFKNNKLIYTTGGGVIVPEEEISYLYTDGIEDCIGVSVWDNSQKIAALYHVSRLELMTRPNFFEDFFTHLKLLIEEDRLSQANITLISCYWSSHMLYVFNKIRGKGFTNILFNVSDALIEHSPNLDNSTIPPNVYAVEGLNRNISARIILDIKEGTIRFAR